MVIYCDEIVQSVQKCDNVICILRAHLGMMLDPILWNGSTKGDVAPTLPWDTDFSPVANDISAFPFSLLRLNPALSLEMNSRVISSASI